MLKHCESSWNSNVPKKKKLYMPFLALRQRESFMKLYGQHLPPIFFKSIPSLKEKPPYFSPTLSDVPSLNFSQLKTL